MRRRGIGFTLGACAASGLIVNVPPFISEGDKIKIDTDSGSYVERVK